MKTKLLIIMICLLLSGCVSHEQTENIYIVYTNDVASRIDENFGYAGVKGYKTYLESENNYVCLVDAGDYYDGRISELSGGEYITQIMNVVGYDVVAVGNQEFQIGLDHLAKDVAESDFDYVSCNIKYTGSGKNKLDGIKPYVIKNFGGVRVAFIGVTTPEVMVSGKRSCEAITVDNEFIYHFYEENEGKDLYEQVQKTVNKIRKKAEYVILLSHLGSNSVTEGFSSYDVIANTTGIDVVIDGHSHTVIPGETVSNKDGEDVVLTSTGEQFENLGVLILRKDHTFSTTLYPTIYEIDAGVREMCESIYEEIGE